MKREMHTHISFIASRVYWSVLWPRNNITFIFACHDDAATFFVASSLRDNTFSAPAIRDFNLRQRGQSYQKVGLFSILPMLLFLKWLFLFKVTFLLAVNLIKPLFTVYFICKFANNVDGEKSIVWRILFSNWQMWGENVLLPRWTKKSHFLGFDLKRLFFAKCLRLKDKILPSNMKAIFSRVLLFRNSLFE